MQNMLIYGNNVVLVTLLLFVCWDDQTKSRITKGSSILYIKFGLESINP